MPVFLFSLYFLLDIGHHGGPRRIINSSRSPFAMVSAFHCQIPGCPSKEFYLLLERWPGV